MFSQKLRIVYLISSLCVLAFSFSALAQNRNKRKIDTPEIFPGKRLNLKNDKGTLSVRGVVGGDSQDRYVINLTPGKKMTVTLQSDQNKGEFSLCDIKGGFGDSDKCVEGANAITKNATRSRRAKYNQFKRWVGKIPKSGDYGISVVAYPGSAKYTLIIKVE